MYFQVHKNTKYEQPYWWVIKASGNHANLAHSEMYKHKADCVAAMRIVMNGAGSAVWYDKTGE